MLGGNKKHDLILMMDYDRQCISVSIFLNPSMKRLIFAVHLNFFMSKRLKATDAHYADGPKLSKSIQFHLKKLGNTKVNQFHCFEILTNASQGNLL